MKGRAYLRFVAAVVFVISGLWLGGKIFLCGSSTQQTATAEFVRVSDKIVLTGTVFREETPVCAEGDFIILPAEGQWLCGGDTVAVSRSAARAYFDYASYSAESISAADLKEAVSVFYVSKNREEQRSASTALSALLYGREDEENEHIPLPRETVRADFPGYFSRFCDGFEGAEITGDISQIKTEIPENCLGKTVSGSCWYFAAETDDDTLEKLRRSSGITLDSYAAQVWKISGSTVVFRVKSGVSAHLTDREKALTLSFCEYEGIRIPEAALSRERDGNFISIQLTGKTEKLPVEIIYAAEDYLIVRGDGLAPGMKLLLPQKT